MSDTKELNIIAPALLHFTGATYIKRWLKAAGDVVKTGDGLVILTDRPVSAAQPGQEHTVLSPAQGTMQVIDMFAGQEGETGATLCRLLVAADYRDTTKVNWDNFDEVSMILEDFAEKSKVTTQKKSANEALGQLLGVADDSTFQRMNTDQQNQFIQSLLSEYKSYGLNPADLANKLLQGLHLKTPQLAPSTPAPVFGISGPAPMAAPAPGGMGGGTRRTTTDTQS